MTKEMHPSHRINVLSDALVHYGQKSAKNLCMNLRLSVSLFHFILDKLLPKRLEHARKLKKDSAKELQQLLDSSPSRFN